MAADPLAGAAVAGGEQKDGGAAGELLEVGGGGDGRVGNAEVGGGGHRESRGREGMSGCPSVRGSL